MRRGVALLCLLLFFFGCAHLQGWKDPELLRKRVRACWEAKAKGQWDRVYDRFLCKAYKDRISRVAFISSANLKVSGFEVGEIELRPEGREAEVEVSFDTSVMGFDFKGIKLKERWLWQGGDWCLMPQEVRGLFEKGRR